MTRISDSKAQHFDNFDTAYIKHITPLFNLILSGSRTVIEPEPIDYKHLRNGECWCGAHEALADEERRYWDEASKTSEEGYDELYDGGDV